MASPAKAKGKKELQRAFAFDLLKPMFKGNLLKQGGFHKAFKDRFFVLYPGFLVYYDTITTWQYDLQRGETLGSRLSAIKLRGGSVAKAKNPPRGAKYAFMVTAPDPANRRNSFLFNAKSNEERYQWMVKIGHAIPGKDKRECKQEEKPQPKEEKKTEDEHQPSVPEIKQDPPEDKKDPQNGLDDAVPESPSKHNGTAIEDALGPRDTLKSISSIGSIDLSQSPEHKSDPSSSKTEPDPISPKTEPDSSSPKNEPDSSDLTVVSSVTVEVNQDQKGMPAIPPPPEVLEVPEGVKRDSTLRIVESSETVIPALDSPRLSISVANGTTSSSSDSYDSDDDSDGVELPDSPVFTTKSNTPPSPTPVQSNGSSSPLSAPQIAIETVEDERQPNSSSSSSPKFEKEDPSPQQHTPTPDRRRPSGINAFLEKRGYLYKQGGKHKTWHLRYFVLQPGMFTYYKNDPKGKALGEVKLSKRTKIYLPKKGEKTYSSFQFTIYSPSDWNKRSTYIIAANNEREMKEWIDAFKDASGILRDSPEHTPNGRV